MPQFKKPLSFYPRFFCTILIIFTGLSAWKFDRPLLGLHTLHTPLFLAIFKTLSYLIFPPFHLMLWIGAFCYVRLSKFRHLLTLPLFEIAITQCLGVGIVRVAKVLIGRARPEAYIQHDLYGCYGLQLDTLFHSFPSGHTMTAFTLATSCALLLPSKQITFIAIATVVSLSRVALLDHYLSDVVGTACLGAAIAWGVHTILTKITNENHKFIYEKS